MVVYLASYLLSAMIVYTLKHYECKLIDVFKGIFAFGLFVLVYV